MKRRHARFLLYVSLSIAIFSAVLLPFSYYFGVTVFYVGKSTAGHFGFGGGSVVWVHVWGAGMQGFIADNPDARAHPWTVNAARDRTHYFDFNEYWRRSMRPGYDSRSYQRNGAVVNQRFVALPLWLPAWLFAIPPAIVFRRDRKRRQRIREGLCLTCGYDLRSSGERCPECGATRPITS